MKKVLISVVIVGLVFVMGMEKPEKLGLGEEQITAVQKAVLSSHREMIKTIESLDVDKFYESIIDSGMGTIVRDGNLMTRDESLGTTKTGFERTTKLKYEFSQEIVKVLSPETAIFVGKGKSTVTIDTGETFDTDFAVSSVFVLKDGKWKIIHGHHSIPNPRQN